MHLAPTPIPPLLNPQAFGNLDVTAQRIHIGTQTTAITNKLGSLRGAAVEWLGDGHPDHVALQNHIAALRANFQTMIQRHTEVLNGTNAGTDPFHHAIEDALTVFMKPINFTMIL